MIERRMEQPDSYLSFPEAVERPKRPELRKSPIATPPPLSEKGAVVKATEKIKTNTRAVELLGLMKRSHSRNSQELGPTNVEHLVDGLRDRYPTVEDIRADLAKTVAEQIGVASQQNWTREQYEQAVKEKGPQRDQEAVQGVVAALTPVYEQFGAVPSKENKARIIKNLTAVATKRINPRDIPPAQQDYIKKNVLAAAKQKLTPDEAKMVVEAQQRFFESQQQDFSDKPDPEIKDAIKRIREESGLALQELQQELGISKGQPEKPQPKKETPPEALEFRLQGGGIERRVKHPGTPVEIYLGDIEDIYHDTKHDRHPQSKRLQIIDVRNNARMQNDPRWNKSDYLLVDPSEFDPTNPETGGYKALKKNESIILGRGKKNSFGFNLPNDAVYKKHVEIQVEAGGEIVIKDLGPGVVERMIKNPKIGTRIILQAPRQLSQR